MTLSSGTSSTLPPGVRLFDRCEPQQDPSGAALQLRLDRARVWADERELSILGEHVAETGRADELTAALSGCVTDRCPLLVWEKHAVGGPEVVRWVVRTLAFGGQYLIDGGADRRLDLEGDLLLPLPTGFAPRRWKPATTGVSER